MAPAPLTAGLLTDLLPAGTLTMISGCSAESEAMAAMIREAADSLQDLTFSGVFVPGFNRTSWISAPGVQALTFFQTPELRDHRERVTFLPICYQDILAHLHGRRPTAALVTLSGPDADGWCSFGTELGFIPDLWDEIPVRVAHINHAMPHTPGHRGVRFADLTAVMEVETTLPEMPAEEDSAVASAIGEAIAPFIESGATIQTGLGKIPTSVLAFVKDRRDLHLHTGLIGDGVLALLESGSLAGPGAAVVGAAIGTRALYQSVIDPVFSFQPVSITHDPLVMARHRSLITINSALEIDLFGQAYAELTAQGLLSGPGGGGDFARGARLGGGVRIVALPSEAKGGAISRIVPPGTRAPVSLGRADIDVVVTEHGAADLRDKSYEQRAQALIAIAAPGHREGLAAAWRDYATRL